MNNAALTYADIAAKYKTSPSSVEKRAFREKWTAERAERMKILSERVREKTITDTVSELTKYNEQDLIAAKAMRGLVAKQMKDAQDQQRRIEAKDLRALAGAMESAQRIARLALGASTTNTDSRNTIINEIERLTPEERKDRARDLYSQIFPDKFVQ